MQPNQTYIICSTMRSGSTLLCDLLTNTHIAGSPQEFFLPKWEKKSKLNFNNYQEFVKQSLEFHASGNGVSGVKIMWDNFESLIAKLKEDSQNRFFSKLEILQENFPNLKFILISRRNKVRQAISLTRSIKSNQWNKYEDVHNKGKSLFNKYANASFSKKKIIFF